MRSTVVALNEAISAVLVGVFGAFLVVAGSLTSALVFGSAAFPGVLAAQRGIENGAAAVSFEPQLGGLLVTAALIAIGYLALRVTIATRSRRPVVL